MACVVLADEGDFGPTALGRSPLSGTATAFTELALALVERGHEVVVRNNCPYPVQRENLDWAGLDRGLPEKIDLFIANRDPGLLSHGARARRRVLWIHNTAHYLIRRHLSRMARWRPAIVFSGAYHRSTYPWWAPAGGRAIIPYGVSKTFLTAPLSPNIPAQRAIFTSNPIRSLSWLVDLWARRIHPTLPKAELHVFAGPEVYGRWGARVSDLMEPHLRAAREAARFGVVVRAPVSNRVLSEELSASRVHLYRGDRAETFCLAIAESQAMGVPGVVQPIGSVVERIADGVTGFVARDDEEFATHAIALLTDDGLWLRMHEAASARQRTGHWSNTAAAFEKEFL